MCLESRASRIQDEFFIIVQVDLIVLIPLERRRLCRDRLNGVLYHLLPDLPVEIVEDVRVVQQELPGIVASLAYALPVVGIKRPALLDQLHLHGEIENFTGSGNTLAVQHVHDTASERRSHLVLLDRDLGAVADDLLAFLDGFAFAHVDADGGVELQSLAARGGFGVAVHHTDLFAQLVNEDDHGVGLGDHAGQLPKGL